MAKYESEMLKKSSESLQASQVMRNRLREVLGDERRFTRLPSIQNKGNQSTRGSTGHTQIITLWGHFPLTQCFILCEINKVIYRYEHELHVQAEDSQPELQPVGNLH